MSQWRARRSTNSNAVKPAPRPGSPHWTACSLFPNRSRVNDLPIPTPDPTRPDPSHPPYLRGLNGPQRQAVLTTEGPVRSEECRGRKEGVGTCSSRWVRSHYKKKVNYIKHNPCFQS